MKRIQSIVLALQIIVVITGIIIYVVLEQQNQANQGSLYPVPNLRCDEAVSEPSSAQDDQVQVYFTVGSDRQETHIKIWRGSELIFSCTNFGSDPLTVISNAGFTLPVLRTGEPFSVQVDHSDQAWTGEIIPAEPDVYEASDGKIYESYYVSIGYSHQHNLIGVRQTNEAPVYE